jgi:predicted transcriptional regulator
MSEAIVGLCAMVAPAYAKARSALAKQMGMGKHRRRE